MQVSVQCIEAWTAISRTLRRGTEGATAPNAGRTGIHNGSVKWLSSLSESHFVAVVVERVAHPHVLLFFDQPLPTPGSVGATSSNSSQAGYRVGWLSGWLAIGLAGYRVEGAHSYIMGGPLSLS